MNGDSSAASPSADAAAGYYRRYYNLRSKNGGSGPKGGVGAGASCSATACDRGGCGGCGGWPGSRGPQDAGQETDQVLARFPLRQLILTLAMIATVVVSLGMVGMHVNIRLIRKQLCDLSSVVEDTVSKVVEIKRKQETLYDQLYDHVHQAEEKMRDAVETLVHQEMWLRDNDKTGLVDFALESAGGRVVSTNGTQHYDTEDSTLSFLGIPLYEYHRSNPSAIIQPDMSPGSCWAFRGGRGVAVVSLLGYVRLSAVSLEHIPSSQAPTGVITSAPRDFSILALTRPELDEDAIELARFEYEVGGQPLQLFNIAVKPRRSYRYVALRIESNHGHPEFTCVYRLRVHGSLSHQSHHLLHADTPS